MVYARGMRYEVVLIHSDEGYSVSAPELRGCYSQGASEAEARQNIKDAIREYLLAMADLEGKLIDPEFGVSVYEIQGSRRSHKSA